MKKTLLLCFLSSLFSFDMGKFQAFNKGNHVLLLDTTNGDVYEFNKDREKDSLDPYWIIFAKGIGADLSEAKSAIKNILMNVDIYRQEQGSYPDDIEDMEDDYLYIKQSLREKWIFGIDLAEDGRTGTIIAVHKTTGGTITFDVGTGRFTENK